MVTGSHPADTGWNPVHGRGGNLRKESPFRRSLRPQGKGPKSNPLDPSPSKKSSEDRGLSSSPVCPVEGQEVTLRRNDRVRGIEIAFRESYWKPVL